MTAPALAPPSRRTAGSSVGLAVALVLTAAWSAPALPRPQSPARRLLTGIVTTQGGTVALPGAVVTVTAVPGGDVDSVTTDSAGRFTCSLAAGRYRLTAALTGFQTGQILVEVGATDRATASIDLELERVTAQVDVALGRQQVSLLSTLSPTDTLDVRFVRESAFAGESLGALLNLLPGVVRTPAGLSIRGGRPTQATTLVDTLQADDPYTGAAPLILPADAIAMIEVAPSPYAVEFGGFSSGVTRVTTRQGSDSWQVGVSNLDPEFRRKRDSLQAIGIRSFAPRVALGGPLLKNRVFLAESAQFRYTVDDAWTRPETERSVTRYLTSVTRVDAVTSPGHTVTASLSLFPQSHTSANLDTFNPVDVTYDTRHHVALASLVDSLTLGSKTMLSSTIGFSSYSAWTDAHGEAPMQMAPGGHAGNYFRTDSRSSTSVQWTEEVSALWSGPGGDHLFKFGGGVVASRVEGSSRSRPVVVVRADGSRASETRFNGPSAFGASAVSASIFAQDRWQLRRGVSAEIGVRADHDGVVGRTNVAPRAGIAVTLGPRGAVIVRAGVGRYVERSPLNVAVFGQAEARTVTTFAPDGVTSAGAPVTYVHEIPGDLRTPRATAWNVSLDVQLTSSLAARAGHLERRGHDDLIVDVRTEGADSALVLQSSGRSRYVETEFALVYAPNPRFDLRASYVRSSATTDLNAHALLFGAEPAPLVWPNEYGVSPADVPGRLLLRARGQPRQKWRVQTTVEWRSGLPYSAIDEEQRFVGPRNRAGRFPSTPIWNVAIERQFTIAGWRPWLGVRVNNVLNTFAPRDVQNNIDSPAFGQFYNPSSRDFTFLIQLLR